MALIVSSLLWYKLSNVYCLFIGTKLSNIIWDALKSPAWRSLIQKELTSRGFLLYMSSPGGCLSWEMKQEERGTHDMAFSLVLILYVAKHPSQYFSGYRVQAIHFWLCDASYSCLNLTKKWKRTGAVGQSFKKSQYSQQDARQRHYTEAERKVSQAS